MVEWKIASFESVGPLRFGMTSDDVDGVIGVALSIETDGARTREFRSEDMPVVTYKNNAVSEVEISHRNGRPVFKGKDLFGRPGATVLQFLEEENGGALGDGQSVLFENIGMATGRLDLSSEEGHWVSIFVKGEWDGKKKGLKSISFK